ncbi:bestrophin family protein [Mucilaginibacter defluvii]|uniref:Bestrophin family ion channel n=1 Tax=Mucilaginibacter defluvii TaxID=1196019 RepID=A0ABP9FSH8_9SPHI
MISYNPKEWFRFIFTIHRADTLRELFPLLIAVAVYAVVVEFLMTEVFRVTPDSALVKISYIHQTIGFLFSLLLAFRINSAYDRWWEGRKLWGSLVNNSRNLAIKLKYLTDKPEDVAFFNFAIPLYARALMHHLRDKYHPEEQSFIGINPNKHVPNQIAAAIIGRIYELNKQGLINQEQLLSLNPELTSFTDICGACERIKKTPIPFSYSVFIKKFIFTYIMTLPFAWAFTLSYYVVPFVAFILFVFASVELIAEEIENPFGTDANDLPLQTISDNIRLHVGEIFY